MPDSRFRLPVRRTCRHQDGAEIAFAGYAPTQRKSSALNTLVGHTRLAFVSKTPGRTQLINIFRMNNGAALVDLPGYGYAKVPEAVRKQWVRLLESYLTRRESLIGLILIMDSRHPLTPLDQQMLNWFTPGGRPVHVLLSKADKLTRSAGAQVLAQMKRELPKWGEQITVQLFSSLKKIGMEEAESVVSGWMAPAMENQQEVDGNGVGDA